MNKFDETFDETFIFIIIIDSIIRHQLFIKYFVKIIII